MRGPSGWRTGAAGWRWLAAGGLALALTSPAYAATVSVNNRQVSFEADPGEANVVTVTLSPIDPLTFTSEALISESGAPLIAGEGCRAVDERTAICTEVASAFVDLGDGADSATVQGRTPFDGVVVNAFAGADTVSFEGLGRPPHLAQGWAIGGMGNDTLIGGLGGEEFSGEQGDDIVRAGAGNDQISGDQGTDRIDGGAGSDHIASESPLGNDLIDGGAGGHDTVDYSFAPGSVRVNLAAGTASGSVHDRLIGIEEVWGSYDSDILRGNASANLLFGSGGADRLLGGGGPDRLEGSYGPDVLIGGPGRDRLKGGPGNDILRARDGRRDSLDGRAGRDCAFADALDRLVHVEMLGCAHRSGGLTGRG